MSHNEVLKSKLEEYGFSETMVSDLLKGKTINTMYGEVSLNKNDSTLKTVYHVNGIEKMQTL